jgi:hypothetical protein
MSSSRNFKPQNPASKPTAALSCGGRVPSNQAASAAAGEPGLGNRREYFHPTGGERKPSKRETLNKIRRETLADARQAARIFRSKEAAFEEDGGDVSTLAGRGVCLCGWHQIRDHDAKVMRVRRDEYWHAYTTGTQLCGLRHVCPVCTAKAAEEDRRFVNDGLAAARALPGVFPVMLTLTTRHSRREKAEDVLAGVKQAEQRVKRLKVWDRIKARSIGYVRAFEWTFGRSGHHPHFHTILLIEAETEAEAVKLVQELQPAYMRQLARAGRDGTTAAAWRHSFQVQGAAAVEGYITKWGQAEEITQGHRKEGRGEGFTPWQLLRRSRTLDDDRDRQQAAAVWWEIVQATKGVSQLYKSAGFLELVEAWRELEPEGEEPPTPEEVSDLGVRKGRWATPRFEAYRVRTLAVREAAERHDDLAAARAAVECELAVGQSDDGALDEIDAPDEIDLIDDDDDDGLDRPPLRIDPPTAMPGGGIEPPT